MTAVFADTGGWIALLSRDDRRHDAARERYRELVDQGARMLTSNYVVDETATRLRYDLGLDVALRYREMNRDAESARRLRVMWVDERLEDEAWRILEQYADVALSLTDATSAAVARKHRVTEMFACDRDFEALGFVVRPGPG